MHATDAADDHEDVLASLVVNSMGKHHNNVIWVNLQVEGEALKMELDTGSHVSIIPYDLYKKKFGRHPLHQMELFLKTHTRVNPWGTKCKCGLPKPGSWICLL